MLTLSLRKFWPQMFPKIKSIFSSSFSDNNSIVLLIYNPLTAWLLPLFWHLMLKFGAVIIQHFILALLSKKNSSWFVASMQGKKNVKSKKGKMCVCVFFNYISAMRMQHISTNQPLLNKGGQKVARM